MDRIHINPLFYIVFACSLLIVPLPLLLAWLTAAFIHELCHIMALKVCKCAILSIEIGITGAKIITEPMSNTQEWVCAAAGPVGGLLLMFFVRDIPLLSLCGFMQSVFNLIPISPFDGGRILRCFFVKLLGNEKTERMYPKLQRSLCILFCVWMLVLAFRTQVYLVAFLILPILRSKNLLAKRHVSQYNRHD